ncbi:cadherin-like beta sandwich domain-containing protein [Paenibacillus sp. PL2-23]|uniref:cadherin-like beta sandwich domain-containing protein n=1 Tax=Paenibacillus sp. PL2-23 TaxID=2100729 RepID=UPI0030FD159A
MGSGQYQGQIQRNNKLIKLLVTVSMFTSLLWIGSPAALASTEIDGAFIESGGAVSIEAESALENSEYAYSNARGGAEWTQSAGLSGSSMLVGPDVGSFFAAPQNENAPQLTYKVNFSTAGSYSLWLLYKAPNTGSDSVYAGYGDIVRLTHAELATGSSFLWKKVGTFSGIGVGYVDIQIWAREDGLMLDKLYLTTGSEMPSGMGPSESDRETLTPDASGAWMESGGQVGMEAEAAAENSAFAFADARGGAEWTLTGGSSGDAMRAWPDTGAFFNAPQNENAPELTYQVKFETPGNYKVWLLYRAPNTGADSVYVGYNDEFAFANTSLSTGSTFRWQNVGTLTDVQPGYRSIHFWAREDGLSIDKIYLTTGTDVLTGTGPPESDRENGGPIPTSTVAPSPTPTVTPTASPTPSPTSTPSPTPTPSPTSTPSPTPTPSPTSTPSPAPTPTATVIPGTVVVDTTDPNIVYRGAWSYSGSALNNYGNDQYASNATNNYAELNFTGISVYWITSLASNRGMADIYIDGNWVQQVDLYSPSEQFRQIVFFREDLGSGPHTIRVQISANKNSSSSDHYVTMDVFAVPGTLPPAPAPSPGSGDRYVTPEGSGTMDGSSWANAMNGNWVDGLQKAWDSAGATGTVFVGSGDYDVPQILEMTSGGLSVVEPKKLQGVDRGSGLPVFHGDFSHTMQRRGTLIEVASEVSYWLLEDIEINRYYYGVETKGRNVGYRILNVDVSFMSDGLYLRGGATAQDASIGSNDILIEDSDFKYYTKRGIRFRDGNYNATVNRCTADAGGEAYWVTGNFPFSFQVADADQAAGVIDRDITFNDCEGRNNYHNGGTGYWNGDSFVSEWNADNITYNRCKAFDNTDGGWDVKATNTYLNDCVALGNKRGFRFWSTGEAVMNNCIAAYSDSFGAWIGATSNFSKRANVIMYDCTFFNNGGNELRIEGGFVTAYNSIFADTESTSNLYSKIDGGDYTLVDSVGYGYVNGIFQGTDPEILNPTNEFWTGVGADFNNGLYGSSKGYYQPNLSNMLPSSPRTQPVLTPDRYVTPTGSGSMDGSSWSNALSAEAPNALQSAWNHTAATGTLYIGSGNYVGRKLVIAAGGTDASSPKRLVGVDTGGGLPVFSGSFTRFNQVSGNFIDVSAGASYWEVKDIQIRNYAVGIYTKGRNVGFRISNVDVTEMSDGFYLNGGATAQDASIGSHDILIEDCDFMYYTKRGLRIRGGHYDVVVNNSTADAGGEAYYVPGNFPFGFQVADSNQDPAIVDRNITFNDCISSNNYENAGSDAYWNADGFVAEKASDYITFNRSIAFGNTDGGWDIKSDHAYLNDCISYDNKRAYRFWSSEEAVIRNSVGYASVEFGGMPAAAGVWAGITGGEPANVFIYNSEIYNNAGPEVRAEGGNITFYNSIVSEGRAVSEAFTSIDPVKLGSINFVDSKTYYSGVSGMNPQYVLKSLDIAPGTISFDEETFSYSLNVSSGTTSIAITPTAASMVYKSLTVNGNPISSGSVMDVSLAPGLNVIVIELTAYDDTQVSYVLEVDRQ